jgi:hypothetical protein
MDALGADAKDAEQGNFRWVAPTGGYLNHDARELLGCALAVVQITGGNYGI